MRPETQLVHFEPSPDDPCCPETEDHPLSHAGESTLSVHGGELRQQSSDTLTTPIHQTSTYWFSNSEELKAYQEGRLERDEYGRYGNPTWRAVERKLSDMEGAESSVLFASGMSAATTTLFALLPRGGHLIITSDCYRRTRQFCRDYLSKMGVETTVIEPSNLAQLEDSLRDDTNVFFSESPTNPYLRVLDVKEAVRLTRRRGAIAIIDATFATPVNYRPLVDGADLVIHSASKYFGGHNDLLAGTASGSRQIIKRLRDAVGVLGGITAPQNAYLLLRGLKTLGLRMARHNDNAFRIATWLENHPRIRKVYYPGLKSHPDHEVAARTMKGFGGVVTFEVDADLDTTARFVDRCKIPYIAPSLGGVESLIEMPAIMSYWDVPREERLGYGISDSLVRFACGIEDTEDLLADLEQALAGI